LGEKRYQLDTEVALQQNVELRKRNDFIPEVTIRQNVGKKGLIKAVQVQYSGRYFKDTYAKSGRPGELLQRCGLTAKDIERAVRAVMKRKVG
jgi:hypothetical protein